MLVLWVKVLHVVSIVAWFSGLFYLPRLFIYHIQAIDEEGKASRSVKRFKLMERRLYNMIMWPAAMLTNITGVALFAYHTHFYVHAAWMYIKLGMLVLLWVYHLYCGRLLKRFSNGCHPYHQTFYRFFNEVPTVLLIVIVSLVILKP